MFCQKCGNEMPDDSAFCPKCATPTGSGGSPEVAPFNPVQTPSQNTQPKKKMKKGCLIALLIPAALAVIFVVYCFVSVLFEPDTNTTTSAQTTADSTSAIAVETTTQPVTTKTPVTTTAVQVIKISAGDLISAYANDEAKADRVYKGKLLEISGTIEVLGVDSSPPEIDLSNGDPMASYLVACFLTNAGVKKAAALNPGNAVTIVGTCSGLDSDYVNIVLKNSYIK